MAEVKNAFIKSKMNKDLDSRLLPRGEYRDGQNIQVSKSEGEDVGALENVVGNLPASTSTGANVDFSVISGCGCNLKSIGVFADTNSSTVYVFLTDYTEPQTSNITYSSSANNYIYAYIEWTTTDKTGNTENYGKYIFVKDVWIRPQQRSNGILKSLIKLIDQDEKSKKAKYVFWLNLKNNKRQTPSFPRWRLAKMGV